MEHKRISSESIQQAAEIIASAKQLVVLTGAGMSVDSGVNDFRSKSGWWKQIDPRTVATVEALQHNYDVFHAFYSARMEQLDHIKPHEGHYVLHKWERKGIISLIATQNVDGLHQAAGCENVTELHGSIYRCCCSSCGKMAEKQQFINRENCSCGGPLRPNVVLFGETLPEQSWSLALAAIAQADVVLVIGTSLEIYPVNQLPAMTNGKTIFLNKEDVGAQHSFDVIIHERALDGLVAMDRLMA